MSLLSDGAEILGALSSAGLLFSSRTCCSPFSKDSSFSLVNKKTLLLSMGLSQDLGEAHAVRHVEGNTSYCQKVMTSSLISFIIKSFMCIHLEDWSSVHSWFTFQCFNISFSKQYVQNKNQ